MKKNNNLQIVQRLYVQILSPATWNKVICFLCDLPWVTSLIFFKHGNDDDPLLAFYKIFIVNAQHITLHWT